MILIKREVVLGVREMLENQKWTESANFLVLALEKYDKWVRHVTFLEIMSQSKFLFRRVQRRLQLWNLRKPNNCLHHPTNWQKYWATWLGRIYVARWENFYPRFKNIQLNPHAVGNRNYKWFQLKSDPCEKFSLCSNDTKLFFRTFCENLSSFNFLMNK